MTWQDDSSRWRPIQTVRTIVPGIREVSTASHGGLVLSDELNVRISAPLHCATRMLRHPGNHRYGWAFRRSAFRPEIRPLDYPRQLEREALQSGLFD